MPSRNEDNSRKTGEQWDDPEGLEAQAADADAEELSNVFMLAFSVLSIGAVCLPVLLVWELLGVPPFGAWVVVAAVWLSGALLALGS